MVNPGAFLGSRKAFLLSQKAYYKDGVVGGYAADVLAQIQRKYFKRYPLDLPHHEEPTAEWLAAVDDESPDVEQDEPDITTLDEEQYAVAVEQFRARKSLLKFRKAQIKRWLAYQHMKDQDIDPKESGAQNPYRILLHKLTGTTIQKPRLKSAANVWRKTQRQEIDAAVKEITQRNNTPRNALAATRDKVARDMFSKLSQEEQAQWILQAKEEHDEALARWKQDNEAVCSTTPEDRQRCIQGLVRFAQPILELVTEATGWACSMLAGGPEPAHAGRLNMISIHSGVTMGDVKMNFGRAEQARYRKYIVPIYGQFLQKTYSLEECRRRALAPEEGFEGLESGDLDAEGATFDSCGFAKPVAPAFSSVVPTSVPQDIMDVETSGSAPVQSRSSLAESRPATPPLSPAASPPRSRPATPPLSPAMSPPRSRPATPPLSPAMSPPRSRPTTPLLSPTANPAQPRSTPSSPPTPAPLEKETDGGDEVSECRPKRSRAAAFGSANAPSVTRPSRKKGRLASGRSCAGGPTSEEEAIDTLAGTGVPAWFSTSLAMLQSSDNPLGERWTELVRLWVTFEQKEGFKQRGKLSPKKRPDVISEWIRRARSPTWQPVITNVSTFEKSFHMWWLSLQPKWRLSKKGEILTRKMDGDLDGLRKPGLNGLLSVLAALFFWGRIAQNNTKQRKGWIGHVEDCILVLRGLVG